MRKVLIILLMIVPLISCAKHEPSVQPQAHEMPAGIENIGGKYNMTLEITNVSVDNWTTTIKKIKYVKGDKVVDPDQILPDEMRPGLDWLKDNTPTDAVIMCWWDYGHAIRAYSEREPVVDAPSKEILTSTVAKYLDKSPDELDCPDCVPHVIIQDVASLLVTEKDPVAIMKKYSADYLYVSREDAEKSIAFFIALGLEPRPIELTNLGRALREAPIENFDIVYSDKTARIYQLKE